MGNLTVPPNGRRVGEYIYCGATSGLSTEHAVPYALNGPWTLLEASCADCRDVTHRFERDTLHGLFPAIRAVFRLQTRRRKQRPTHLPLLVVKQGQDHFVQVPLNEFPVFLQSLSFHHPALWTGGLPNLASVLPFSMHDILRDPLEMSSRGNTQTPTLSEPA